MLLSTLRDRGPGDDVLMLVDDGLQRAEFVADHYDDFILPPSSEMGTAPTAYVSDVLRPFLVQRKLAIQEPRWRKALEERGEEFKARLETGPKSMQDATSTGTDWPYGPDQLLLDIDWSDVEQSFRAKKPRGDTLRRFEDIKQMAKERGDRYGEHIMPLAFNQDSQLGRYCTALRGHVLEIHEKRRTAAWEKAMARARKAGQAEEDRLLAEEDAMRSRYNKDGVD